MSVKCRVKAALPFTLSYFVCVSLLKIKYYAKAITITFNVHYIFCSQVIFLHSSELF